MRNITTSLTATYFLGLLLEIGLSYGSAVFTVWTPAAAVTTVHGQPTVLSCSFPAQGDTSSESLVINWQRVDTKEVVYSYYYGREQLGRQSPRYSGRTSMFPTDIKNGNASLRLDRARAEDTGQYMCFVSSLTASGQGVVSLTFAAYYTEPQLFIRLTPSERMFTLVAHGFPEASVCWYSGTERKDICVQSETWHQPDGDGLYLLHSVLAVTNSNTNSSYSFELRNDILQQSISRTFNLSVEMETDIIPARNKWMLILSLSIAELTIILILARAACRSKASQHRLEV
ncbi:CD276 antigen-like [Rhinoraja longicauda]